MRKLKLMKTLLVAAGMLTGASGAWAVDVPTPVYFKDFSSNDGLSIVGNGVFEDDADPRFGKIFHNDPTNTSAIRTNYLKLPADVLSHSATSKQMSIGFWVNKKSEDSYWFSPLFSAYGAAPDATNGNNSPMFVCETRGLLQLNCSGWCDFGINSDPAGSTYNDGSPYVSTTWLDDAKWHYYTVVLTETTAKVYIDGELKNGWTVDGTSGGQVISGLFTNGSSLSYICLGGNQAWTWADADPAFGFDDFAVYDAALSAEQIAQIISDKNFDYTVVAKDGSGNTLKTIASGTYTGTDITVAYPQNILSGTTLYKISNNGTGDYFRTTFTPNEDNYVKTLTYNNGTVADVCFYVECEDIKSVSQATSDARASYGKMGYTANSTTYIEALQLPAGTYQIVARPVRTNSGTGTCNFKVGDDVKFSMTMSQGTYDTQTSESFTIDGTKTVHFACEGSSTSGLDWFYITGTPSNEIIGALDYSTGYLGDMTDKVTLKPGESYKYSFVNHNSGGSQWLNYVVPVYASNGDRVLIVRADNWEDVKGTNAGCSSDFVWGDGNATFISEMNGATVDMTLSYSKNNVFSMRANITTANYNWTYSYKSDYAESGITLDGNIQVALSVSNSWLEILSEGLASVAATVGANGYATFASPYALDLTDANRPEGLKAYKATLTGATLSFEKLNQTVPAGTGLLLLGETNGGTYNIPVVASGDAVTTALTGVTADTPLQSVADGTYYFVMKKAANAESALEFAPLSTSAAVTIPAGKAYVTVLNSAFNSTARSLTITFDDPSGINNLTVSPSMMGDGKVYNLNGQRVTAPTKGLYIINGRKVAVK